MAEQKVYNNKKYDIYGDPPDATYLKTTIDDVLTTFKTKFNALKSSTTLSMQKVFEKIDIDARYDDLSDEMKDMIKKVKEVKGFKIEKFDIVEGDDSEKARIKEKNAGKTLVAYEAALSALGDGLDGTVDKIWDASTWGISVTDPLRNIKHEQYINDLIANDKSEKLIVKAVRYLLVGETQDDSIFDGVGFTDAQKNVIKLTKPAINALNAGAATVTTSKTYITDSTTAQKRADIVFIEEMTKAIQSAPYQIFTMNASNIKSKFLIQYKVAAAKSGPTSDLAKKAQQAGVLACKRAALSSLAIKESDFKIENFKNL